MNDGNLKRDLATQEQYSMANMNDLPVFFCIKRL